MYSKTPLFARFALPPLPHQLQEEDIFDGSFSNSVPGSGGEGLGSDLVVVTRDERGSLPGEFESGEAWRCITCLTDNDVAMVKCGCCERRRLR